MGISPKLASVIREPLKSYGVLVDYVVHKVKTSAFGEHLERSHPLLKREAVLVEDAVRDVAAAAEKVLRRHGRKIVEMQFTQRRIADMTIDIYAMLACITRTTRALEAHGEEKAAREVLLTRAYCGRAAGRIRAILRQFDNNDDDIAKSIADDVCELGRYPFDAVLDDFGHGEPVDYLIDRARSEMPSVSALEVVDELRRAVADGLMRVSFIRSDRTERLAVDADYKDAVASHVLNKNRSYIISDSLVATLTCPGKAPALMLILCTAHWRRHLDAT